MQPKTYLAHEKLEPLKLIDMEKDFQGYDPFDIGAMGEFDVDVLVEQYAGRDEANAIYPEWRGGYYFAGSRRETSRRRSGCSIFPAGRVRQRRRSSRPCTRSRWPNAIRSVRALERTAKLRKTWRCRRIPRTLRGRHAWLTEEGVVVLIEVRGGEILIEESLDDATTKRVEGDFWPAEKSVEKAPPAKP